MFFRKHGVVKADIVEGQGGRLKKLNRSNCGPPRKSKNELIFVSLFCANKGDNLVAWVYVAHTQNNFNAASLKLRHLRGNANVPVLIG